MTEHTIATSNPPPRASPSIAATDGFLAPDNQNNHQKFPTEIR